MHNSTIEWLFPVTLTRDAALANKRWSLCEKVATKLSAAKVVELVNLFVFSGNDADVASKFTQELGDLDPEFPRRDNHQELRLMAGLVMVHQFEQRSRAADAFALGCAAADFPSGRAEPVEREIYDLASQYLHSEALRMRPKQVTLDAAELTKSLHAKGKLLVEAEAGDDDAKRAAALLAYRKSVADTISDGYAKLEGRLEQLAEETELLWWAVSEYSSRHSVALADLQASAYAISAALEAASRTMLLPPPRAIFQLISKVLRQCKQTKKPPRLASYLDQWQAVADIKALPQLELPHLDFLAPLTTMLRNTTRFGSSSAALECARKCSPLLVADLQLIPDQVAHQLYAEVMFLRSLDALAA